jgi:hypothetical protein
MPKTSAVNGAKNSTSFTFTEHSSAIQSLDTLGRQLSKLYARTRNSKVRHTSCYTMAICRRREQPIRHAALLNA